MIEEGSRIMLVDARGGRHLVVAKRGMIEVRGLGAIDGEAICESSLGDSIDVAGRRFAVVRPSVLDVISFIDRRAQIISPKDSFQIPIYLDIGCGSRVLEAGAGSGAMTLVLLHAVAPSGVVYTYEIREDHAKTAERNVGRSENASCWRLKLGDVCQGVEERDLDAAVLDMPNPWDALEPVAAGLRPGGHICCYVPNANQLEQTVRKMRGIGLSDVFAFETLQREMTVHERGVRPSSDMMGHTGYLAFARRITR